MVYKQDLLRLSDIAKFVEPYIGPIQTTDALNGGLLNRFCNDQNSIMRLEGSKRTAILKLNNLNENIIRYFRVALEKRGIVHIDIPSLLTIFSLLPEHKEVYIYEYLSSFHLECFLQIYFLNVFEKKSCILMEDLSNWEFFDYLKGGNPSIEQIRTAIRFLGAMHCCFMENNTYQSIPQLHRLCSADIEQHMVYFDTQFSQLRKTYAFIENLGHAEQRMLEIANVIDQNPKCLTHNDFNMRNTCFCNGSTHFKVFDWDLACIQNPEFDLAEYLVFLQSPVPKSEFEELLHLYQQEAKLPKSEIELRRCLQANFLWFLAYKWTIYASLDQVDNGFIRRLAEHVMIYLGYLSKDI